MLKKQPTRLEKEWKNLELGEMQEYNLQIGSNNYEQDDGYDLSENRDTKLMILYVMCRRINYNE
jgi:hypothetical protein